MDDKKFKWVFTLVFTSILLEMVSPVPLILTVGALYVLFARPVWFKDFILKLYGITRDREQIERMVIDACRKFNNTLTVMELASCTSLSMDEAEEILNDFVTHGRVTTKVSDEGIILYHFDEITALESNSQEQETSTSRLQIHSEDNLE